MIEKNEMRRHPKLLEEVWHMVKIPILLALLITPVRFSLELLGLPENAIFMIGVLWLTLGIVIYWGVKYRDKPRFLRLLFLGLLVYSPLSRVPVAIVWWIDKNWELGTHYSLYFNTFGEVLWNQMVYGSLIQVIPGFILGMATYVFMQYQRTYKSTIKNG